jgi:hypothetical protein
MKYILWLKHFSEYIGGEQDHPPEGFPITTHSMFWGLWWGFLAVVIVLFCGQSSKFIYIDF